MTTVHYCSCGHHQQVHTSTVSALCRGRCISHTLDNHTGRCTAKCPCDAYAPRRDRQ